MKGFTKRNYSYQAMPNLKMITNPDMIPTHFAKWLNQNTNQ